MIAYFLIALQIVPANFRLDRYEIVPTLGRVAAITASPFELFVLDEQQLIILEKNDLKVKRTVVFDIPLFLMAWDQFRNELWLTGQSSLIRYNLLLGTAFEYPHHAGMVNGLAVTTDAVYFEAQETYALQVATGTIIKVTPPEGLTWIHPLNREDLQKKPFLSPYYYQDTPYDSRLPWTRFNITALWDDGLNLYVGTDRFGILCYNNLTWQRDRLVYGLLDRQIRQVRQAGDRIFLLTGSGLSVYDGAAGRWFYRRFDTAITDFLPVDSSLFLVSGNRVIMLSGTMVFPLYSFPVQVLTLSTDGQRYLIGTENGAFQIFKGTNEILEFGPRRYPVRTIMNLGDQIYLGTDNALYRFDSTGHTWKTIMPFGVKKILPVDSELYCLSPGHQLICCHPGADSQWTLLPYFNVFDIATDGAVIYCAGYNGLNYYDPATGFYKPVYRLPRVAYRHVFIVEQHLLVVADNGLYRLALADRD